MGNLHVLQVVIELLRRDPSPVRVHDVALEEIEAPVVAQSQIVRVPYEASIPPEEGVYPPEYLRAYGFQASKQVRELCRVWIPQEAPTVGHGAWIAAPTVALLMSVPSRLMSNESCRSVWPISSGSSETSRMESTPRTSGNTKKYRCSPWSLIISPS